MKKVFLVLVFFLLFISLYAQESNCGDGIDNDGDGFIDCFDGDCALNPACEDSYIGRDKACQAPPELPIQFAMTLAEQSANETSLSYGRFVVGDLDGDGFPEVVTTHRQNRRLFILNGTDLSVKYDRPIVADAEWFDLAIGKVNNIGNNNNCARIFIAEQDGGNYYITSFDCTGTQLWRVQASGRPYTLGLADFDHDGAVELYYRNEILDADTGIRLVNGLGDWNSTVDSGPVAVDILDDAACTECAGLELVVGGLIYAVDLSPRTAGANTLGAPQRNVNNIPGTNYHPKYTAFAYTNSQTSVADFNLDGHLDVLMNGATGPASNSPTTVFFWDVHNNTVDTFTPLQQNETSWNNGAGRLNVADIDGDGLQNVTFVSGTRLFALNEQFDLMWPPRQIFEATSGFTSTTVFDFNNDGAVEIVYRDEQNLYIIDGNTGNDLASVPCKSRTSNEYPIVVDVDNDGATEICVTCNFDNAADVGNEYYTRFGHIRMFKSALDPWVPSRKVWNQHAYFNVNVNDDLSIPRYQQQHHLVFSENVCGPGEHGEGDRRALNTFLNQSAILDSEGCTTYPAADLSFLANPLLITINPPTCPERNFTASFTIQNTGDLTLNGSLPITFYASDPRVLNTGMLNTVWVNLSNFGHQDILPVNNVVVEGTGGSFTLFAVLNDDGSTNPLDLPNTDFFECNYDNNVISVDITPALFDLTTETTDHIQCDAGATPNGTAEVYRLVNGAEQTTDYTFHWFDGPTVGDPANAVYTGPSRQLLPPGTYSVFAEHNAFHCVSSPATVTISQATRVISAQVTVDHAFTNCFVTDGALSVQPGDRALSDYGYQWFEGTVFGTSAVLSQGSSLTSAEGKTYSVLVTELTTGCETIASGNVPNTTITPVVTATSTSAGCNPANSGSASATVNGTTSGYTFDWYDGNTPSTTANYTPGATYQNITAGYYTVVATDNSTGCESNPFVVEVSSTGGITASASVLSHHSSCAASNGSAQASVGGQTNNYTFQWFSGLNTSNPIGDAALINGLPFGTYTVQATYTPTGCTDTEVITINDTRANPNVVATVQAHQTNCLPPNGQVSATANGTAGPHVFYWFDGNIASPDTVQADFKGATYVNRPAGFYTVVAVNNITRCTSARQVVEVNFLAVAPVISTIIIHQTTCNPTSPNGGASASVNNNTSGYKFRWFAGIDTTNFLVESASITGMPSGAYVVKAQNLATRCEATSIVTISNLAAVPALSLGKIDNIACNASGFTGSVTSAFVANPNVQPAHTFVYSWSRNGVSLPGEFAASLAAIDAGVYEVVVLNQTLGCSSAPVSIQVLNNIDNPDLTTASQASTNCTSALVNGFAEVTTVDTNPVAGLAGYSYEWHLGNSVNNLITNNASANQARLLNVQGGVAANYTVRVTNLSTGCYSTATVLVGDAKVDPSLSFQLAQNTICDPMLTPAPGDTYNGSITASVLNQVGSLSDYTFSFSGGMNTGTQIENVYSGLNGGVTAYSVSATHLATGCQSTTTNVVVTNNFDTPDLVTNANGSTNCVSTKEDGEAIVTTIDNNPPSGLYSFSWTGPAQFSVTQNTSNTQSTLQNVQGGAGYDYTVVVTNLQTGCVNSAIVNVPDVKVNPQLTLAASPNVVCDPVLATDGTGTYGGEVQVTINNQVGGLSDYTFNWSNGTTGVGIASLTGLQHGNYTVGVVHDVTGCASSQGVAQVLDGRIDPSFQLNPNPSENCSGGAPDGSITVAGLGAGNFGFEWYDGNSATGSVMDSDATYEDIQGGTNGNGLFEYTVVVTDLGTGCQTTTTTVLADGSELPQPGSITTTPNTFCVGLNGTATLTSLTYRGQPVPAADFSLFTFSWSGGVQGSLESITQAPAGLYTLTVTHDNDNCTSNPVQVTIVDDLHQPQIVLTELAQSSCDISSPNGRITAQVAPQGGGPLTTNGYSFSWENRGSPYGSANIDLGSANEISGLVANRYYEVEVVDGTTGCVNTAVHSLSENIVIPLVTTGQTPQTFCAPANGIAEAVLTNPNPAPGNTFSFYWLREQPLETTTIADDVIADVANGTHPMNTVQVLGVPNSQLPGIVHGRYTVVVRDEYTDCLSQPVSVDVDDDTDTDFNIVPSGALPNDCTGFGAIEIVVENNTVAGPVVFDIDVYQGGPAATDANLPIDQYSNPPLFTGTLAGQFSNVAESDPRILPSITSGLYTIVVEDNRGCRDYETYFLPYLNAPSIEAVIANVTSCNTDNGALQIRAVPPAAGVGSTNNQSSYTFSVHSVDAGGNVPVLNLFSPPDDPAACTGGIADPNPVCSGFIAVPNLSAGVYLLEILDEGVLNCPVQMSVEVLNIARPAVVGASAIGNTSCALALPDGAIDLTITKDPADLVASAITYNVDMTAPTTIAIAAGVGIGSTTVDDLAPDTYAFEVTSSNGCVTQTQIAVPHQPIIPQLSATQLAIVHAEFCDQDLEQSARISVNAIQHPGGASELLPEYQFTWFGDAALTDQLHTGPYDAAVNSGGDELDNQDVATLGGGTVAAGTVYIGDYYLQVTKIADTGAPSGTGGLGCVSAPLRIDIEDSHDTPQITLTPNDDTGCMNSFEGSIEVDVTTTGPGTAAPYTYAWTPNGNPGIPSNSAGNNGVGNMISSLQDGDYTLMVTNQITLCTATLSTTVEPAPPAFTILATEHDVTLCNTFNGQINNVQILADGNPESNADFDFVWSETSLANVVLNGTDGLVAVDDQLSPATYAGIDVGTYYIRAVRKAGGPGLNCQSVPFQFDIEDLRIQPLVNLQSVPSSACDDNLDGQITVTASTAGPGAGATYNVVWTSDPDGMGPITIADQLNQASPITSLQTDVIGEALYTVRVTNMTTACFTDATHNVTQQSIPLAITSVSTTPVQVCSLPGNGTATVTGVANGAVADYTYAWADNPGMNSPFATNDAVGTQTSLNIGTFYVRGVKDAVVTPFNRGVSASGCTTSPFALVINDQRVNPDVSVLSQGSTSCDMQFDGEITILSSTPSGPGVAANYNITWLSDPDNAGTDFVVANALGAGATYNTTNTDKIGPGTYNVRVTNALTSCFSNASVSVSQNTVPFDIVDAQSLPQQSCLNPDGQVSTTLNAILLDGNPVNGNVVVTWFDDQGAPIGNGLVINNLPFGDYSVSATRQSGTAPASGCMSSPLIVHVDDMRMYPTVQITATPNTACDNNVDGSISLIAATVGAGALANYDFQWIVVPQGSVVSDAQNQPGNYTTSAADLVGHGQYEVVVTNLITGCATVTEPAVLQVTPVIQILNVDVNHQYDCAPPDGSLLIDATSTAYLSTPGNYMFFWEQNQNPIMAPMNHSVDQLTAGNYSVSAVKVGGPGSGCMTSEFDVVVEDRRVLPVVDLTAFANYACNTNYNGQIDAVVSEGAGLTTTAGYAFEWFQSTNADPAHVLPQTTPTVSNVQDHTYTVRVTDLSAPGLNCMSDNTIVVPFLPTVITGEALTTPQTLCQPLLNGAAEIITVQQQVGAAVSTHDMNDVLERNSFVFEWFDHDLTQMVPPAAGDHSVGTLSSGTYYVTVSNALGCSSLPIAVVVEDATTPPQVFLDDFLNPQVCVLPATEGFLQISADNSLNLSDYIFTWYNGDPSQNDIVEQDNPILAGIGFDDNLTYTARVTNKATNCFTDRAFTFQVDTAAIRAIASSIPISSCVTNNGGLFAAVTEGNANAYSYQWYSGNGVGTQPAFVGKVIQTAPLGFFTVIAKDPTHDFCNSVPAVIEVKDGRIYPDLQITELSPVTYCDTDRPNGAARASVEDASVHYRFDWFTPNDLNTPFYVGAQVSGLSPTEYIARATHTQSGCATEESIVISYDPHPVASPSVVILSHETNCETPDGALQAIVSGNAAHDIVWYDDTTVKDIVDHNGEFYRNLSAGHYTTVAHHIESGCNSNPVVTEVLPFMELPDFEIDVTPTTCEQNIGAAVYKPANDVAILSIIWEIGNDQEFGTTISGLPKGSFVVTATSMTQCVNSKTFEILPDILVFNGVSKNGDGKNDVFEISCIEDFPNNQVKIFNRAGTLVYAAKGYNNSDIAFDGISNEGISLLGRELPDGTYFYIIDRGDGSKPAVGYLELRRSVGQ